MNGKSAWPALPPGPNGTMPALGSLVLYRPITSSLAVRLADAAPSSDRPIEGLDGAHARNSSIAPITGASRVEGRRAEPTNTLFMANLLRIDIGLWRRTLRSTRWRRSYRRYRPLQENLRA